MGHPWLVHALLAASALAQSIVPPAQDPEAEARVGVLHALVALKIAPYLTVSPKPPAKEKPREKPKDRPKEQEAPKEKQYRIGLLGVDGFTVAAPQQLTGKRVDDATVRLVRVELEQAIAGGKNAAAYDMLYIAASVPAEAVRQIVKSHAEAPVPLVSRRPGFAAMGGGVQLFVRDNGIRFEINGDALRRQGVHVDSQLRKLSRPGPI